MGWSQRPAAPQVSTDQWDTRKNPPGPSREVAWVHPETLPPTKEDFAKGSLNFLPKPASLCPRTVTASLPPSRRPPPAGSLPERLLSSRRGLDSRPVLRFLQSPHHPHLLLQEWGGAGNPANGKGPVQRRARRPALRGEQQHLLLRLPAPEQTRAGRAVEIEHPMGAEHQR